jgi:2-succinyl-6-hydroxy-2,4-cyclohexadiene-1-carboxylate synthase
VNGIDGIVSTALGMARARGGPALLITGDIAFLHNLNAAAGAGLRDIPLTVLLLNNDGGEIFDMLPVRDLDPAFTRHFTTPHGVDFASACAAFEIEHRVVVRVDQLPFALSAAYSSARLSVVEVRTSISESGDLRRDLLRELAAAVDAVLSAEKAHESEPGAARDGTVVPATGTAVPATGAASLERQAAKVGRERFPLAWRILARSVSEPVLLLHGFTRSSASWDTLIGRLPDINAVGIDLMGHGAAPSPDPVRHLSVYGLDYAAEQLRSIIERLGIGKVHLAGYSLGGRTALHFASLYPELLRSLALMSVNPGIEDDVERSRRGEADAELALRIDSMGLESFVAEWSGGPLFAAQRTRDPAAWHKAHRDRMSGRSRGLQGSLLGSGQGTQLPLWAVLPRLELPVLVAAGANDGRYAEIAARMHALLPQAELRVFPDSGHDLLFEQSAQLAAALRNLWKR